MPERIIFYANASKKRLALMVARDILMSLILIGLYYLVTDIWNHYRKRIIVSDEGVTLKDGILITKSLEMPFENIHIVTVTQGVLGKILDFGTLEITSGGDDPEIVFPHLHDPHRLKDIIQNKMKSNE